MANTRDAITTGGGAVGKAANTAAAGNLPKVALHSPNAKEKATANRDELMQMFQQTARKLQASGLRVDFAESEKGGGRLLIAVYGAGVCIVCGNWIAGECWNPDCRMYQKPQIPQEEASHE